MLLLLLLLLSEVLELSVGAGLGVGGRRGEGARACEDSLPCCCSKCGDEGGVVRRVESSVPLRGGLGVRVLGPRHMVHLLALGQFS